MAANHDPTDAFLDVAARIKTDELRSLLDSKLVNARDAAARFLALSLALDPADDEIYSAVNEYDFHPEIVSVVLEIGKADSMNAMNLVKSWGLSLDDALCRAADEGNSEAMKILGCWGASYNNAFRKSAGKGLVEAMKLLKTRGSHDYNAALCEAAAGGHLEAMTALKDWGADDFDWALYRASGNCRVDAAKLLISWEAWNPRWAIDPTVCRNTNIRHLIIEWLLTARA